MTEIRQIIRAPWHVSPTNRGVLDVENRMVAISAGPWQWEPGGEAAIVRLIAAAPDLLEAAQALVKYTCIAPQDVATAKAAIARATGEEEA